MPWGVRFRWAELNEWDMSQTGMDMSQTEMDMSPTEMDMSQTGMDMSQTETDMSQTEMDMSPKGPQGPFRIPDTVHKLPYQ